MSDIENQSSTASEPSTAVAEDNAADCGAGYLRLAEMMGSFPDIAIFRRFGGLSALNLLYYQAELVYLERELVYLSQKDAHSSDGDRRKYQRDWWLLHQATQAQECVESRNDQYKKFLQIRELLERYHKSLRELHELQKIGSPDKTDITFLKDWMRRSDMGDVWLSSLDRKVWETYPSDELLTIRPRVFDGAASRFIQKYGTAMYHYTLGRMYKKVHGPESVLAGTAYYTSHFIRRVVSLVTISISSLFPILAILILHFIQDQNAQIGIIVALTFAFSLCLGLFFQVRQGEIFAAAAAFAAVQVVFITGNGNGPNSNSKS